jgi:uncharacterized protein (TIGR00299 family) protein
MRIAYLDCASGISGDMTLGALIDAGAELAAVQAGIDSLGLPSSRLVISEVKKRGFRATQITVEYEPEHKHRHLHHITAMIDGSSLTPRAKGLATRIFKQLAAAEARVHGTSMEKVHFHEVGAVDSIADIVGCAIGFDLLDISRFVFSPVPTGHGFIEIAHGRCSIPAPATAELLRHVPLASLDVEGELTTPTGAAIVAALADDVGPMPPLKIELIGYGAGQKDFPQANLLRLLVGETAASQSDSRSTLLITDAIVLLETNLDNASGEVVGGTVEQLWQAGALDVSLTSIQMKKGRPGVLVSVQCRPEDAAQLEGLMFANLPTLGVRRSNLLRTVLPRRAHEVSTRWGKVAGKIAVLPDGSERFSPEYEDCRRFADANGVAVAEVIREATSAK